METHNKILPWPYNYIRQVKIKQIKKKWKTKGTQYDKRSKLYHLIARNRNFNSNAGFRLRIVDNASISRLQLPPLEQNIILPRTRRNAKRRRIHFAVRTGERNLVVTKADASNAAERGSDRSRASERHELTLIPWPKTLSGEKRLNQLQRRAFPSNWNSEERIARGGIGGSGMELVEKQKTWEPSDECGNRWKKEGSENVTENQEKKKWELGIFSGKL